MTALLSVLLVCSLFAAGLDAAFYKPIAIWQIDIKMKASEWTQLTQDSYNTYNMTVRIWGPINQNSSVKELNGTKFNETSNGTIEVHGASSRNFEKNSLKIEFKPSFKSFNLYQHYNNSDKERIGEMVLNADFIDSTFMRQKVGMDILLELGALAPRTAYARVTVNGQFYGFMGVFERIAQDYVKDQGWDHEGYMPLGYMYKAISHDSNWRNVNNPLTGYELSTWCRGDTSNASRVAGKILSALQRTTPKTFASFEASVQPVVSIRDWMQQMMVRVFINDIDTYDKNYYLYSNPLTSQPARVIAWDCDASWGNSWTGWPVDDNNNFLYANDGFSQAVFNNGFPEYLQSYLLNMKCLIVNSTLNKNSYLARATEIYSYTLPYIREDEAKWLPRVDGRNSTKGFNDWKAWANSRETQMLNLIANRLTNARDAVTDVFGQPYFTCGRTRLDLLDKVPKASRIVVNEILAYPLAGQTAYIELYNTNSTSSVDISGWAWSNDKYNKAKFRIPAGTVIPPHGYYVINKDNFPQVASALNPYIGGKVFVSDSIGRQSDKADYPDSQPGISQGLVDDGEGNLAFFPIPIQSPGRRNTYPNLDVVIVEIMANNGPYTANGGDEYIVIHNTKSTSVNLYDSSLPAPNNTWRVSGLGDYQFPGGSTLPANGYAIVCGWIGPSQFRSKYSIPASVQIFGPFLGNISSDGERLVLRLPGATSANREQAFPYLDKISYKSKKPWPETSKGQSIVRLSHRTYGDTYVNWRATVTKFSSIPSFVGDPKNCTVNSDCPANDACTAVRCLPEGTCSYSLLTCATALDAAEANRVNLCWPDNALCQPPVPTNAPSNRPTPNPTAMPTTAMPTPVPTGRPTSQPTALPTLNPTALPTLNPTVAPTKQPTHAPTTMPTPPTHVPTTPLDDRVGKPPPTVPTSAPTQAPTALAASRAPTVAPVIAGTNAPVQPDRVVVPTSVIVGSRTPTSPFNPPRPSPATPTQPSPAVPTPPDAPTPGGVVVTNAPSSAGNAPTPNNVPGSPTDAMPQPSAEASGEPTSERVPTPTLSNPPPSGDGLVPSEILPTPDSGNQPSEGGSIPTPTGNGVGGVPTTFSAAPLTAGEERRFVNVTWWMKDVARLYSQQEIIDLVLARALQAATRYVLRECNSAANWCSREFWLRRKRVAQLADGEKRSAQQDEQPDNATVWTASIYSTSSDTTVEAEGAALETFLAANPELAGLARQDQAQAGSEGLSTVGLILVIVGAVVFVAIIAALAILLATKNQRKKGTPELQANERYELL